MKNQFKFLFCVLSLIFFTSCKKEQPQMSSLNEGCDCAKEVSADFLMEESTLSNFSSAHYTVTDSIFTDKEVRFTAKEENAEYTWIIGNETIHTREVVRFFGENLLGQTIPITLIVTKKPNNICLPNDDGIDTITRNLTVASTYPSNHSLYEGVFRVKSQTSVDSIDITTQMALNGWGNECFNIYNYDGKGSSCSDVNDNSQMNYRQIWFGTTETSCNQLVGNIYSRLDGIIEMNFTTGTLLSNNIINYTYYGRKL